MKQKFKWLLAFVAMVASVNLMAATVTYQHVFNAKPNTGDGITLSGVKWNITATNLNAYNSGNYAGVQIGASGKDGSITLTSPSAWSYQKDAVTYTKIKEVRVWCNLGGTSCTPSVTIGGTAASKSGTVSKNSSAGTDWTKTSKVTFTPAANGNTGVVVVSVSSVKAGYICCLEIDCEDASTPTPSADSYTIQYALDGGTAGESHPTSAEIDAAFKVSAPTKANCTFEGWTVTSGLNSSTAKWGTTDNPSTSITSSSTKCVNGTSDVYFKNLGSKDATVTLTANWKENPKRSISWSVAGSVVKTDNNIYDGTLFSDLTAPNVADDAAGDCANSFRGWATASISGTDATGASVQWATDETATSESVNTFYAVFATEGTGGTSDVFEMLSTKSSVTAGDYVIINSDGTYAMSSDFNSGTSGEFKGVSVSPSNNKVTVTDTKLIWTFEEGTTTGQFSLKNNSTNTYASIKGTGSTDAALSNDRVYFTFGTSSTDNIWKVKSVSYSTRGFSYYSNNTSFRTYAHSSNNTGYLYKRTSGGKSYSDFVTTCVVDDRTPVKMTGFSADETTLVRGATTNTSVTNDQVGWTAAYIYSSDKPEVATVNESGVITAIAKGTATITATLNVSEEDPSYKADKENKSKSIEITVNNPKHTMHFFVNGTELTGLEESISSQEEGAVLACPANPSDIGLKVFVGWKLGEISGSTDDEPTLVTSSTKVGNAEQNYYAVFATQGVSTSKYVKGSLNDLTTGQKVVIVEYTDKMALTSTATDDTYNLKNKSVSPTNNKITSVTDDIKWTVTKNNSTYQFKQGDSFLYGYSDGQDHYNLKFGSTPDNWTIASGGTGYTLESGLYSGYKLEYFSNKFTIYKKDALDKAFYMDFYIPEVEYTAYVTTIASEYAIAVDGSIANGSVEASAASAVPGSTIELIATPADDAYDFEAWNVYKTDEPATTVEVTDNKFEMPNYAVTVSATFKATNRALITWESFGTQFAQTYVSREGKIQMPAGTPTNASDCGSKYQYFMGWSTAIDGVATEAPTYITAETAAPTEATTYYAVFAKGQEGETVKELTFPDENSDKNGVGGYDKTWTAKSNSDSWSIVNLNNNNWGNNWEYIKCGSKSAASVATLATDFAITDAIKKVVINAILKEDNLTSATLYISSTEDFASAEAVAGTIAKADAAADYEFVIPTPAANKYYKLTFDCAKGSNNGFLQINSIAYKTADVYEGYATTCPSAYAITVSQPAQGGEISANVASAEAGETITLTAIPTTGYKEGTWTVYKTGDKATTIPVTEGKFTMQAYPVTVEYVFEEIKVTSITLNKTEYTMDANSAFQLEVTEILPANALNKEVTWSTSDESVATVSETGLVSGVAASATPVVITATSKSDNTVTATCSFTITDPIVWNLKGITVTEPTITTFAEGAEFTDASLTGMVVTGQYENSIDPTDTKNEPITEGYTVKIGEHELPYTITHEDALAGTLKVTVTYNEQSDDFDLTLVPSYKTTWKVNGTAQTGDAYPATADAENKISLPTATAEALIALFGDDQYQFFRGWATAELEEEATSETGIVYAQAGDEISEDKTYYAVFAKGEMAEGWNINTEAPAANESVVLAAKDNGTYYAFTANGSASSPVALTVEDGKITSESPFAWSVSVEDNKMYLKQGNNYVHFNSKSVIKVATGTTNGVVTFTKSGDGFIMTGNNYTISFDKSLTEKQFYYKDADDEAAIFYVFKENATTLTSFLTTKCDNKVPAPTIETVETPTTITLNWAAVTGIDSWNVTFDGETTTVNANTYKAIGLEMESEHTYKVVAVPAGDYCGAIAASGSVSTIACNTPTPENLSVTDLTATTATLNWNAIDGASAYKVQVTDGSTEINMEVATNSYEVTGLSPNTYYMWSVKAFVECWGDANEEGEFTTSADVAKFNLTLNATHGEISSAPEAGLVEEGEDVMMEAINPADGYMFGSWSYTGLTEADVEIDENTLAFTMPHGDVTVTANFIEIPTITWKVCGETVATTPATNGKVGTVQDAPTTWKYDNQFKYFAGWVKGENVETPVYATADMPITENTTFNAAFSKDRKAQYQLVTDVDNLAANDELVIVGLKTSNSQYYAASEIPSTKNYLDAIEIAAPENNIITIESEDVLVFTLGGNTDAWTFKANDKYLASSSAEANLWDGDYKTWKLSNSSTAYMVVMTSVQYTTGKFEFNMSSPRFRNYKGSQEDLYFYSYSGSIYENLTIDPQPDYGRTDLVVGNYGTVCVPYAVKTTDRSGATFWSIETSDAIGYTNPTSVTIVQEEDDLVAGKPYIFCATDTKMALFFSGEEYKLEDHEDATVPANGLYGNLTDGTITINPTTYEPGYFFVLQQKLYECGTNCTVAPNRGWVQANQIEDKTTPSAAPRRTIGRPNGTPTGIDNLNGEGWIELNGAHKYFHNGTIMIVNDGHLYNAQGIRIQ